MSEIKDIQNIDLQDVWQEKRSGVEENVKLKIVLPLLNALGYDSVKDMDFEHHVENKRADIAIVIDNYPKIIVECKSLEKNLDDYIIQAIDYAIRKAIPYIILTNGKEFRLYKPFIENLINPKDRLLISIKLETLVENFEELNDLVSRKSLVSNEIKEKTEKIVEKLRNEITPKTLIENLITAKKVLVIDAQDKILPKYKLDLEFRNLVDRWIKDSELDIKESKKWCEILANEMAYSFINRLYFYRIAEDKGIVESKLNKKALGQITQYIKYNQLIKLSFEEILKIDYEAIFKHDIFDKIEFDELNIKKIIDSLAEYDFSKINGDIIGKIYEYHVSKEERKKLGQFYTPEPIINYIFDNIPLKATDKLLDPACGSGGFLIKAYDKFSEQLPENEANKNTHKQIIENNLFGYDINPFSVHLTAMNLALKNIESKTDVINVLERDSLSDNVEYFFGQTMKTLNKKEKNTAENTSKFNVIVGNPPYFNLTQNIIKEKYDIQEFKEILTGVTNIASLFLKRYISLLEPSGYLGFVLPKSLTYLNSWEGIRKFILEQTEIVKIFDIHEAFEGVLIEEIVLIVQKKPCDRPESVEVQYTLPHKRDKIDKHMVSTNQLTSEMFSIYAFGLNQMIKEKVLNNSKTIKQISEPIFDGIPIQKYNYLFTDKRVCDDDLPILRGKNIGQFLLKGKIQYISRSCPAFDSYEAQVPRLLHPKIMGQRLIAQTGDHVKLIATIDEDGNYLEVNTVSNIVLIDSSFNLKYVLGILNSKLASYYIYNFVFNRAVRTLDFGYTEKLPIKKASKLEQQKIINLVDEVIKEDSDSEKSKELKEKIDKEIYSIYGLTAQEIELIEESYR